MVVGLGRPPSVGGEIRLVPREPDEWPVKVPLVTLLVVEPPDLGVLVLDPGVEVLLVPVV